jgi:DNA-binding transcriptional LysR family regulator
MNEVINSREMPDLRLLMSFVHVARKGSISLAAAELGYVPSAVSQHISALERSLGGVSLFVRKPGARLTLTGAGRALEIATDGLFSSATAFQDVARRISQGDGVEIRIGAYGSALSHLIAPALTRMHVQGRESAARIFETEFAAGLPMLERGDLDILIAHRYLPGEPALPSSKIVGRSLGREPLLFVVSADLREEDRAWEVLRNRDWVAGPPTEPDRRLLDRWAQDCAFVPQVRFESADYHTAVEVVAFDLAVGLLPLSVVAGPSARGRLVAVSVPVVPTVLVREILAVVRTGMAIPAAEKLLDELARAVPAR